MASERIDEIYKGPRGSEIGAFFDYDGTVISGFSARAFYAHRYRHLDIGPIELARTVLAAVRGIGDGDAFGEFLDMTLAAWGGTTIEEMEALGEQLFKHDIASRLHHEVWELIEAHRRMGHTVALASSATRFQVEPMARAIGADAVLCTAIQERDGIITGKRAGATLWGEAKGEAVRALAAERGIDLKRSYGYSNGDEDVPFLQAIGHPCAVSPEAGLARVASERGWPVVRCVARGGRPGVVEVVRTVGFYAGMASAFGAGLGIGLINRSRQAVVEIAGSVGSDLGLAIAGVDVQVVRGAEHLWSARPCVFVFNHQSKLDAIIAMKLLRGGFTGVAKKEAANVPGFGLMFRIADVAFIDRGNTAQAKQALEPAVAKVRDQRISLAIAPEGTRSPTPRLGPFKKGAFHIAMQAGVPIVPIVIRNAGEVMWRGAQTISAGTVEVAVLEPVQTRSWTVDTIGDHVAEVREMFVAALADWPGKPRRRRRPSSPNGRNATRKVAT
jgi:putative phosphoserine phosphatase/1-acylglycerol-3-phosphate O-acyltransferase